MKWLTFLEPKSLSSCQDQVELSPLNMSSHDHDVDDNADTIVNV